MSTTTLSALVDDWLGHLTASDRSPGTVDAYARATRVLRVTRASEPADLTRSLIRSWQRFTQSLAMSTQTVRPGAKRRHPALSC